MTTETKPEKMTDEELAGALDSIEQACGSWNADHIRAHIAALTAERDEARGAMLLAANERDALRERVQTLEAEVRCLADEMAGWRDCFRALEAEYQKVLLERLGPAESRLSAIRQRARSKTAIDRGLQTYEAARQGMGRLSSVAEAVCAAINHVVGEDATGAGGCINQQPRSPESVRHLEQIAQSADHHAQTLAANDETCECVAGEMCSLCQSESADELNSSLATAERQPASAMDGLEWKMAQPVSPEPSTDPMHPSGHCTCAGEGTCAWCSRVRCTGCGLAGVDLCATCEAEAKRSQDAAAEPTTAEAFATVRATFQGWMGVLLHAGAHDKAIRDDGAAALSALSLLERRLGAMAKRARDERRMVELLFHSVKAGHAGRQMDAHLDTVERWMENAPALTDAPRVVTLGEVDRAVARRLNTAERADVQAFLTALR